MDASAFEIDTGLTGLPSGDTTVGVSGRIISSEDPDKRLSGHAAGSMHGSGNAHHSHNSGGIASKNDRRFIARDWFNVTSDRDCELMQIFIDQLNGTNHVNYSKAYILFKERTGFPFSDPKHMRKRMDQIVYTFKTQGDMLPDNVKRIISEYNTALEAAKQRDSSNRKRLSLMEPVEVDDGSISGNSSDDDPHGMGSNPSSIGIRNNSSVSSNQYHHHNRHQHQHQQQVQQQQQQHQHQRIHSDLHHLNSSNLARKRKLGGSSSSTDEITFKTLRKLNENVEKLTRMLESHDAVLKKIVSHLDIQYSKNEDTETSNDHANQSHTRNPANTATDTAAAAAAAAAAVSAASNVLNLNPSLSVRDIDPNHDPIVYNEGHVNRR
ncbi:unnamed protein product [Kluyveromyces dobzhanskii CBS 2104]|uniref:WGS project CCBQ000000000 data, contig 00015 n=1 Tax=Kluyveromyces dobzhanskii CBS 2104 TaxID=1427455 RepID=A0A0A8L8X8_9SACH|nr:unnamed protein product [Kluyveromyces dobzhanskii CBS 2104]